MILEPQHFWLNEKDNDMHAPLMVSVRCYMRKNERSSESARKRQAEYQLSHQRPTAPRYGHWQQDWRRHEWTQADWDAWREGRWYS